MKALRLLAVTLIITSSFATALAAEEAKAPPARERDREKESEAVTSPISGPSMHLAVGIRMRKAPDLDTYYSTVGGIKISAFQVHFGNAYLSVLCPGLHYAGFGVFAPSLTPLIFNHNIGIGFGVDFFTVRDDRLGGPLGMSLNIDVLRIASSVSSMMGR